MSKSTKKIWWVVLLIIFLVLILFFTFRNKNNANEPLVQGNIKKNLIRLAVGGEPASLDPNLLNGTWELKVDVNLFEGLTVRDKDGNIIPGVATRWVRSNDGKVYTFYLRKNAKWSDGEAVTAHDFEFSFKRLLNPKTGSSYANALYIIKGAENFNKGKGLEKDVKAYALDKYTLRIELNYPANYFTELISHSTYLPIPKHIVVSKGKAWSQAENIVSNGAYKLVTWRPRAYIEAIKNPYYWDKDNVKIEKVYFYTQDDNAVLLKRYRANELDILPDLSVDSYAWALENLKNEVKVFPYMATYYYSINLKVDKFKDPKVRLALNMAVDRDFLVQKVLRTPDIPLTYSLVPPGIKGYSYDNPEWVSWGMDKRIEEAKKLLHQAGYTVSNPLVFSVSYNSLESNKQIAVALAAMWKRLGIKVQLFNKEVAVHYADLIAGKYEVGRCAWVTDYADPSSFISLFSKDSGNNYIRFDDPEYNKEFIAGLNSSSVKDSMLHYKKAEKILLNSNSIIPLFHYVARTLVKPWVKGYAPNFLDIHLIKYMSISK